MNYVDYEIMLSTNLRCIVVEVCVFSVAIEHVRKLVAMSLQTVRQVCKARKGAIAQ